MYNIFQPAIQDVLTHVRVSPNILGRIVLHLCPWKHTEVRSHVHSGNTSCIMTQIKCKKLSSGTWDHIQRGLCFLLRLHFAWTCFMRLSLDALICDLSPRRIIRNSTLALYPLPIVSAFYPSQTLIKIELKCLLFSSAFQVCLEAITISSFIKPLRVWPRVFIYHLHSTAFVFTFFFFYKIIIFLNKTSNA